MIKTSFTYLFEQFLFRNRLTITLLFMGITLFLGYQATHIQLGASFTKNIPLNHEYMQTYLKHEQAFGGANSILISVCDRHDDIFDAQFLQSLKQIHDQLFFIPGVNRTLVKSLYSPSTRFVEVVEDGFAGGPVMPADFTPTTENLQIVKNNIEKAGIVGRLVSDDYRCAMVRAQLLENDPDTQEKLDTLVFAEKLEQQIRQEYENKQISIHIIGFAKMIGDIADGAKGVVTFFAIAILITTIMVWIFSKSFLLTTLPIMCSLIAVVWQLGLLAIFGFSIDPMSILIPFLVFAIGVSHGVQMINALSKEIAFGQTCKAAAQSCCRKLLVPGIVALLSDTVGFLTLLAIDIGVIRDLAITASLGVAVVILTNLILLPIISSFFNIQPPSQPKINHDKFWLFLKKFSQRSTAMYVVATAIIIWMAAFLYSQQMKIGDLHAGAPALHSDSRYNLDTALITEKYAITSDVLKIIIETETQSCIYHSTMTLIDDIQWELENIPGVQSGISLASVSKKVNKGFNEGNAKWQVIPRNSNSLAQAVSRIETSTGLLNADCSVIPIILFLEDHKAETIEKVIAVTQQLAATYNTDSFQIKLASGPVGVMAATNEAVSDAQTPMMLYVYGAVVLLCLMSFRSLRATIAVVLPLYIVSTLAQSLMVYLEIGLTVSTLPVIALGVGIGVDYGIYILSSMAPLIKQGVPITEAYFTALKERGNAVLFTGLTLAVGVSTWVFSTLKFQVDMGILLTFMFIVNMLGAILLLPAVAAILWRKQ